MQLWDIKLCQHIIQFSFLFCICSLPNSSKCRLFWCLVYSVTPREYAPFGFNILKLRKSFLVFLCPIRLRLDCQVLHSPSRNPHSSTVNVFHVLRIRYAFYKIIVQKLSYGNRQGLPNEGAFCFRSSPSRSVREHFGASSRCGWQLVCTDYIQYC